MTVLDFVGSAHTVRAGITLVELSDTLWRVTRSSGEVLGYIECFLDGGDRRYRAKRLLSTQSRSLPLGEFWSFADAADCFRL